MTTPPRPELKPGTDPEPEAEASGTEPIAVLTNDVAGRGRLRRILPEVLARLAERVGRPVWRLEARTGTEAEEACQEALAEGVSAVVAVGGDGTLHAALQAVAGSDIPLGVVPMGTGNDLASGFGLPRSPLPAAEAVAEALRTGVHRTVDLARVSGVDGRTRWFGGVLAAGFDAIVNERANRMRWPRGDRRYDVAIFLELVKLRPREYVLTLDGVEHRFNGVLVAVGNTATYGGGIRICPEADPTDGALDVVVGADMSRATLTRLRPMAYRGTHLQHPKVRGFRASEIRLECEGITTYADGERCAPLPVTITAVPGALKVLATARKGDGAGSRDGAVSAT